MIELSPPFRIATPEDAPALAQLVNMAGYGLPHYLWSTWAEAGEDPWDVGRDRQAKKAAGGGIVVADRGHGVVAQMTGYVVAYEEIEADTPAVLVPLIELENQVPGTWYINVIATLPDVRGQGLGGALLNIAERLARDEGCDELSLIMAGSNPGARRLYERQGYAEVARRDCVRGDWKTDNQTWILMTKALS